MQKVSAKSRSIFGVLTYSKDHKKIIDDHYLKYGAFHRDVLDPVQREMKKLSDEGKVEFCFDYVPVPTDFVREKWEEHIGEISSYFYTAFGTDKEVRYIIQDLSVFK